MFPGAAKTDPIDTSKILELFHLKDHLLIAKDALQEVAVIPPENEKLKRLSRRRRQLITISHFTQATSTLLAGGPLS
ncbi:hypothetical protein KAX17_14985 [Candidatus Bipolaricaulota bacterium]|nr:hypothetical protein [Candidatus Bipolaricaulota bacterium]